MTVLSSSTNLSFLISPYVSLFLSWISVNHLFKVKHVLKYSARASPRFS